MEASWNQLQCLYFRGLLSEGLIVQCSHITAVCRNTSRIKWHEECLEQVPEVAFLYGEAHWPNQAVQSGVRQPSHSNYQLNNETRLPETVDDLKQLAMHHDELKEYSVYLLTIGYEPNNDKLHGQPLEPLLCMNGEDRPPLTLVLLRGDTINHFCVIPSNSFDAYAESKIVTRCYKLGFALEIELSDVGERFIMAMHATRTSYVCHAMVEDHMKILRLTSYTDHWRYFPDTIGSMKCESDIEEMQKYARHVKNDSLTTLNYRLLPEFWIYLSVITTEWAIMKLRPNRPFDAATALIYSALMQNKCLFCCLNLAFRRHELWAHAFRCKLCNTTFKTVAELTLVKIPSLNLQEP